MTEIEQPTVILLHGTMGSVLRKNGVKVWPQVMNGVKDHYQKSLTPIAENDGVEAYSSLFTYSMFRKKLESKGYSVIDRVYDWRRNNIEHLNILKQDIQNASNNVVIVAHSMGGVVAKLCLNKFKNEKFVKKVVKLITVGTPWKGSMDAIKFLRYGAKVPEMKFVSFLDSKTSREISPFFPSVYQLLPTQEYIDHLKDKKVLPYNFNGNYHYNARNFFNEIFHNEFSVHHEYTEVFDEYYELLQGSLPSFVEHHEIIGTGVATISVISEKSNREPDANWDDGDGTVPIFSSYSNNLESNYYPYFVRKRSHSIFMSYPFVIRLIDNIIKEKFTKEETPDLFFSLDSEYYKKFEGYIQKIACPVDVSITNNEGQTIYGDIDAISDQEIREIIKNEYNVNTLGTTTYIVHDVEDATNIDNYDNLVIEAYDKGTTSISIDKYQNGEMVQKNAFSSFTIDPQMKAIVNLSSNLRKSSLTLSKDGKDEVYTLNEIKLNGKELKLPNTELNVDGDFLIHKGKNTIFAKREIKLSVNNIEKGTFQTNETYINVNEENFKVDLSDVISLTSKKLRNGKNIIEYFSVDEYDNTEKRKIVTVYFVDSPFEKRKLIFDDDHYRILISEKAAYKDMVTDLQMQNSPPKLIFDDSEGVTGYDVVYQNKTRRLKIHLKDIFNDEENIELKLNEKIIKKIIRGTADIDDVIQLTKDLNLQNPNYQFDMASTGKSGNHRKLSQEKISLSNAIEIYTDQSEVKLLKNTRFDVKFTLLTEHINMRSEGDYKFSFRVIDYSLDEYVQDLNLNYMFEFKINEEKFEDSLAINYNPGTKSYNFNLKLNNAVKFIDNFWKSKRSSLQEAKIGIRNNHTGLIIRTLPVTIESK